MSDDPVVILANVSGTFVGTPTDPIDSFAVADETMSFVPDPANFSSTTFGRIKRDVEGNLVTRGLAFTDETSFRDDFVWPNIYKDLTGTFTFTSGSTYVSGSGCAFTTELDMSMYVRNQAHSVEFYALVGDILNDDELTLAEPYAGASSTGSGRASYWHQVQGTGTSIAISNSICVMSLGTVNSASVEISHVGDYLPIMVGAYLNASQRIENNLMYFGMGDGPFETAENQAFAYIQGTDPTKIYFRTGMSSLDMEVTEATLPSGLVTSEGAFYQIEISADRVSLLVNDVRLIQHRTHLPGTYSPMDIRFGGINTGVPLSSTDIMMDVVFMANFDQVQIGSVMKGDPLKVEPIKATLPSGSYVAASATDIEILAENVRRLGATVYNDSESHMYMALGPAVSATNFTVKMQPGSYYEVPFNYSGPIHAKWTVATGSAAVTEIL